VATNKNIKDLGRITGKILVFGGVYSNLPSLKKLMAIAKEQNISSSNIICTGDVVGYCAQPDECAQLIQSWGIHCISGNVEIQLREDLQDCGCSFEEGSRCDTLSKEWYPFAQMNTSPDSLDWMSTLPDHLRFEYAGKKALVLHGSWFETAEFIFRSTPWATKQRNFEATQANLILAGHCGLPFSDSQNDHLWLNAGVIGMPANDGDAQVWYAILDDKDDFSYSHHSFRYDHTLAASLMRKNGLPDAYALTLEMGLWDNMDILPEAEREERGNPIFFDFSRK
jgi:predicted phosphodiesterase